METKTKQVESVVDNTLETIAKQQEVREEIVKSKKTQASSVSYALKAVRGHVDTITQDGLLNGNESETVKKIITVARRS